MKKILICAVAATTLASCFGGSGKKEEALNQERDSLMMVINEKDNELNDIMGIVNEIQDGFRRINEAEGRIMVKDGDVESESTKQMIRENMLFIQESMAQNKEKISRLQEQLRSSTIKADKLKKMVDDLSAQLEQQTRRVQELQAELAEKNIIITMQGDSIGVLNDNLNLLTEDNRSKSEKMAQQDRDLNTAWFVFGTKSELKEQKILQDGDVLRSNDFNKDYFTKIDIRYDKEIKLYSKNAKLLTTHPAGSYKLEKDKKSQYVLVITDPQTFWSVSKYLVIQVR